MKKIFRDEALAARTQKYGIPSHPVTANLWVASVVIILFFFFAIVYGSVASYTKKEIVEGRLWPIEGVVEIRTRRSGFIAKQLAQAGEKVLLGQPLITLSYDSYRQDGASAADALRTAREETLASQLTEQKALVDRLEIQGQANQAKLKSLLTLRATTSKQLGQQRQLVVIKHDQYASFLSAYEHGAVPRLSLQNANEARIREELQLTNMEIRLREIDSEVERLRMAMEEAEREVEAALARRNSIISTYGERELAHSTDQGETLVSPIDGVLIDFTVDESSYFPAGAIIARVARENAQLAVELWVPSKAIGNIEEGTPVTVKLSSLPHRQHGTLAATLVSIADAPRPKERNPFEFESGAQYYRVIAHIDPKSSSPDINISRLRAGISLTADIHVHERSLISYVIDPLRNLR